MINKPFFCMAIIACLVSGCGKLPSAIAGKITIDELYRLSMMDMPSGGSMTIPGSELDKKRRKAYRQACKEANLPLHTPLKKLLQRANCFDYIEYKTQSISEGGVKIHRIDFIATRKPDGKNHQEITLYLIFYLGSQPGSKMEIGEAGGFLSVDGTKIQLNTCKVIDIICDDLAFPENSTLIKKIREG